MENVDESIKVIVVGNGGVGKSSLVRRYCKGQFTEDYKKTIGTDFMEKDVYMSALDDTIRMMVWDTAGQEVFDALTSQYYRGAGAAILAFSTTDKDSFNAIRGWKEKVEAVCGKGNVAMALIQTKIDLIDQSVVLNEDAEALAKALGVRFFRISTKENYNIDPVFEFLAESYIKAGEAGGVAEPALPIEQGTTNHIAAKDMPAPSQGFAAPAEGTGAAAPKVALGSEPSTKRATKKKRPCTIL